MLQKLDPVSSENDTRDNDINDNINVVEGVSQALKVSLTMNLDEENVLTGLIAPSNPAESDLNREENRLATFEREASPWPPNAKMEARKIAKAGLYYTGKKSSIRIRFFVITIKRQRKKLNFSKP